MSWGSLLVNLAVTAGLVAVLMLATFLYAMRTRVHAIMDTIWPLGFVLIAVVSFVLSAGSGGTGRRVLVLALTAVWGLRLGAHIYSRNRGQGEDKRYASLLRRFRADPANAGRVLDRGLWRYTRHPNYFGDAVVWFGLWLLACSHWLGGGVRRVRSAHQRLHPLAAAMTAQFTVRAAVPADGREMAELFAAVAEERSGIASEPPIDIEERAVQFAGTTAGSVVAVADGRLVGILHVEASRHGFGEIGMLVHRDWRGRGVGSALLREAISRAREEGLHKLCLEVFAHNTAAIALYRRCGFAEEGRRAGQYRRASGELWDYIIMGLPL